MRSAHGSLETEKKWGKGGIRQCQIQSQIRPLLKADDMGTVLVLEIIWKCLAISQQAFQNRAPSSFSPDSLPE